MPRLNYNALIPFFAILGTLQPTALESLVLAITAVAGLQQLR